MLRIGVVVVAIGVLIGAADPKPSDVEKELEKFQGAWVMVSLETNGVQARHEQIKSAKLVVEGDKYTTTVSGQTVSTTIALDPAKTPKAIDISRTDRAQRVQTLKGIYKLEGDRFTMCRSARVDGMRPTEFTAPPRSGMVLVVWRRSQPDAGAKEAAIREELAKFQGTWQLVSAETDGRKAPEERVKQIRVTITGNTHTVRSGDQVIAHDVSFDIDPSHTPKTVTDTINEGPEKGARINGIYRLEGDTLTSCVSRPGEERPTEFVSKPGSGYTLRVFRRVVAKD